MVNGVKSGRRSTEKSLDGEHDMTAKIGPSEKSEEFSRAKLFARLRSFVQDERGQSTTEYILILAVVVMIAMKFKDVFQTRLMRTVDKLGSDIESAID